LAATSLHLARMPDMGRPADEWAIVVPVKRLDAAKTRLQLDPDVRIELALAIASDTVRAALACPRTAVVIAVSDDARATPVLRALGAVVVPDQPDAGLNPALRHGASVPEVPAGAGVAALAADLPALRPEDLADMLAATAQHGIVVVADAAGAGTTLLAAVEASRFRPMFGAQSRTRHVAAGAVDLSESAGLSLRSDVDTVADLRTAYALGLGPATTRVVQAHDLLDRATGAD
jgi:2-phospho-L-lactate/phosphoenolpyruvate guanylyltransferase